MKETTENNLEQMSFGEHLDVLRASLIKIAAVSVLCGIAAFFFKEQLFSAILAPKKPDFITYRLFQSITTFMGEDEKSTLMCN